MALAQVQYGSQGNEVRNLQKALNTFGYKLDEDGIFGTKTQAAVKEYQKKNGLAVDGIVGTNTWASLQKGLNAQATATKTAATKSAATNTANTLGAGFQYDDFQYDDFNYDKEFESKDFEYKDFSHADYQESETVAAAKAALEAQLAQKPGEYQSQWQSQLDDTIKKILNREQFSYDFNGDALYQQYKDKYIQQGKMAMADTMGQAAAMTGGYGNSYAASVGNQAYQQSLQQLNDVVPELYQLAYDRYNQEGQDLYNQYAMLGERESADYGRYRDTVSDWQTERDYLTGRYDSERDYDYSKYTDDRNFKYNQYADDRNFAYGQHVDDRNFEYGQYIDDRNYEYGKYADDRNFAYGQYADDKSYAYSDYRDQIEDAQWQATFDEGVRQYNEQFEYQQGRDQVADDQWNQSFQYQQDRDKVADAQWNQSFQYQQDRDKVADAQWNKTFQYNANRDKIEDAQWNKTFQYQQGRDEVADSQWDKTFQYQQNRDKVADSQWQQVFDYNKGRDEVADSQWQQEFGLASQEAASNRTESNAKTYYETGGKVGYDNGSVSTDNIKLMQKALGIDADGKWGSGSTEAAGGLTADQAWKAYQSGKLGKADVSYDDVVDDCDYFISQGASKSEIGNYIREALQNGYISQTEYNKLKEIYIPRGQVYGTGGGRTKDTSVANK